VQMFKPRIVTARHHWITPIILGFVAYLKMPAWVRCIALADVDSIVHSASFPYRWSEISACKSCSHHESRSRWKKDVTRSSRHKDRKPHRRSGEISVSSWMRRMLLLLSFPLRPLFHFGCGQRPLYSTQTQSRVCPF